MADNRIFNVNGRLDRDGGKHLQAALELALSIDNYKISSWTVSRKSGLILNFYDEKGANKFPCPMSAKQVFPLVMSWLESEESKNIELDGWDVNADHDGDNGPGWRVYCEDWGKVEGCRAIAVKPVFMWYGK